MTPAARSRELFDLAEPMSTLLRGIELGLFDTEKTQAALFAENTRTAADMVLVINNWQSATGERVKERPTGTVVTGSSQAARRSCARRSQRINARACLLLRRLRRPGTSARHDRPIPLRRRG